MSAIEVERVSKLWGSSKAVDDVSFAAAAGSLLVLLGPSGCGKSTTLRLIAGLEAVSAGRVRIGGVDVTGLPPARRKISMVFQSYALFPHLTVAENILFGLRVRRVPAAERAARLKRVAQLLGLERLLDRKPSQLSGGQQQRVALGRAVIAETPVCLMDEPLSNLDAQLRHEMRREIRALQQKLGITMVYVTHDQTEAMTMADQVILLRDGRIEQDAPPDLLYARPATAFAARFIGTPPMSIVALADTPDASGGAVVRETSGPVVLAGQHGGKLLMGVRPEHVRLSADGGGVPARVETIEYLGADSVLTCAVGGETMTVRTPGKTALAPGAAVGLNWSPEDVHFFDAESGYRRGNLRAAPVDIAGSRAEPLTTIR
ncbi:MAG TPA: ABC transporter ATP-binding protein [Stellaceae bacterium]|jgi:sn-glycerol 3-phosphate transport system ATP-binding protein